ncbi:expressed unknown protein [Seminavis robusta]|uniref:Uncharacterized protein n=1 Tax=Seminavis robusta TaxID=568900 RepID=A0A9N8DS29_9STRA|nr:expressed unknown protein [Seminavis robusta]|eukprot:Sro315_g115390.1 n/a (204) ;mRNA; r:62797-63511
MAFNQGYPFDLKKFPEDDDILLDEDDLTRKNVLYCRKEILQQMKCTQWAKDDYLAADKDPENHAQWRHYHLQRCYTPYMDALGCVVNWRDKEVQKMKREAGPEGWKILQDRWIHDVAQNVGATKAKHLWEMSTNMKELYEQARQREGPMYGEQPPPPGTFTPANNPQHDQLESFLAQAKRRQLQKEQEREEVKSQKSFWSFGR